MDFRAEVWPVFLELLVRPQTAANEFAPEAALLRLRVWLWTTILLEG